MKVVIKLEGKAKVKFRAFGITFGYITRTVKETWNVPFSFGTWEFPIKIKNVPASIVLHTNGKTDLEIDIIAYGTKVWEDGIDSSAIVEFVTKGKELRLPIKFNQRGINADLVLSADVL